MNQFKKCLNCNDEFEYIHANEKYCTEICRDEYKKSLNAFSAYKTRINKYISSGLLKNENIECEFVSFKVLYKKQYGFCAFCRQRFDDTQEITFDHIIPIIKSGSHSYKNVELLHKVCNSIKHDTDDNEFKKNIYYKLFRLYSRKEEKKWLLLSEEERLDQMEKVIEKVNADRMRIGGVK